jgi:predicted porin
MKRSLLALAVLGAFTGVASAQSSVVLYGRVDLSINKNFGDARKGMSNGSGSRFGVRGVEDLGGGLSALFNIEARFDADTGGAQNFGLTREGDSPTGATAGRLNRFWGGRSIVGLQGGFGQVVFGREYTTAFLQSQLVADPWGWDTANAVATAAITGGGIAKVRNDSSATYRLTLGGFQLGAQYAEATDTIVSRPNKPYNFAVSYAGGPITAGFGYEVTGEVNDAKWLTINGAWNFGAFKIGGFYGDGTNTGNQDVTAWMATLTAPIGAGEFRFAYGERERGNTKDVSGFLVGYHYSLSKRTTIYADYGNNSKLSDEKSAYDIGLKHNF